MSEWLKQRYGLTSVVYLEMTPTLYGMACPLYGWKRADVKN